MSEIKKFLDKSGISYLWSQIDENFVNGEQLTDVVKAIDEVKVDTDSLTSITESEINEICI